MHRPPAFVLWLATLASGIALGLALGSRVTPLAAQNAPATAAATKPSGTEDAIYRDLARSYERFQAIDRIFAMVAKVVSPAVVHITAQKVGERDDGEVGRYEETGSGVIVRLDGGAKGLFVLTNNHVVDGAAAGDISILLHDGQILKPTRFWADVKADVAVLKLDREGLPTAKLGNSDDAHVGTWVMALGSPFGLTHSVSQGIISARGRYEQELEMDGVEHQEFLQTDAAINPGNSGGPLVNMKGEVIGLNTAIASEGGGSEGVGFSIPINLAKWAMTQLVTGGKVLRGAMGVNLEELTPAKAEKLGLEKPRGAGIAVVHAGSPAEKAGLRVGDIVLVFNGNEVVDDNHLINLVSVSPIGQPSELVVWRDKARLTLKVMVAERDAMMAKTTPKESAPKPRRTPAAVPGITLVQLDRAHRTQLFGRDEVASAVLVASVAPGGPYADLIQVGDAIESIGGKPVEGIESALKALQRVAGAAPLDIRLRRLVNGAVARKTVRVP